jgi:hypothetical protein
MKLLNNLDSDESIYILLTELRKRNDNDSFILLENYITKELINNLKGRMHKDESILIKVRDNLIFQIYNRDVGDEHGSFGYTVLYCKKYIPPEEPEILSVDEFFKRENKLDPDYKNPLKDKPFISTKNSMSDFMDLKLKELKN